MNAKTFPCTTPLSPIGQCAGAALAFAAAFQGANRPPTEYKRNYSSLLLHETQMAALDVLLSPVKKNGAPGRYYGAVMDTERTELAAEMSGDWNDVHVNPKHPHPRFGKLIAHGMDTVSQALIALKLELHGTGLVPKKAEISFVQPVYIDEDILEIRILPGDMFDPVREIEVYAQSRPSAPEKLVARLRVRIAEDPFFDEHAWFGSIMSAWRISALLAKTWPGCLYLKQQLDFHQPLQGSALGVYVRGDGFDAKGRCKVHTQAHREGHQILPAVSGQAIIVLPPS